MHPRSWRGRHLAVAVAATLLLAGCTGGDDGSDASAAAASPPTPGRELSDATFVFGASADPVVLDGAYVSDGESIRVVRQVFEGLVTTAAGGTEIEPALATSWQASEDGLEWTFELREGVVFHDGAGFDAEAVCANFDRWYGFSGVQQSSSVSYYWQAVMGGFAENESEDLPDSLFAACVPRGHLTVSIVLTRPSSTFLSALSLPAFSMASPAALVEFGADEVTGSGEEPQFTGTYGMENPTGTGPFRFVSWERGNRLVLERNEDYWGEQSVVETLVFVPIADGPARRQALEAGEIDGYDLVDPADVAALAESGFQVLRRPAFNVGYLGFNQAVEPLDNPFVRRAIAHAVDRERLLTTNYPEGSAVATQFVPPSLFGHADNVTTYDYDPVQARRLLIESGNPEPTVELWYPTRVSRPYMPDPAANVQLIQADLEQVGFTVEVRPAPWTPDYLDTTLSGGAGMYLLGWSGDFGDPDNFVGTFFQNESPEWGMDEPEIRSLLDEAEIETDPEIRTLLYEEANRLIMEVLPGLPYVHTEPAVALAPGVEGYVPSPVGNEDFSDVVPPGE